MEQTGRPNVVGVATPIWWAVSAIRIVVALVAMPGRLADPDQQGVVVVLGVLLVSAWSVFVSWLALRMARGSGNARLWLAILAGLAGAGGVFAAVFDPVSWGLLEALALVAAGVLSYLPAANGFFPVAERRPRQPEPKTVGWDPETGERITETPRAERDH